MSTTYTRLAADCKTFFLLLTITFLFGCCNERSDEGLSIIFTGDVLLDRGVRKQMDKRGIDQIFASVKDTFLTADATIINLECPLTDTLSPVTKIYMFKGDTKHAKALKAFGVTHAAMANNHTYDQGTSGLRDTKSTLDDSGIVTMGYGLTDKERTKPAIMGKNGVRVAVFNSVFLKLENWIQTDGEPGICTAKANELASAISEYKKNNPGTWIVAVVHWGVEFMEKPSVQQQIEAMTLAQAGTDLIVGHHTHVTGTTTNIGDCLVLYSLGNFVFDQRRTEGNKAKMAKATFGKERFNVKTLDIDIQKCRPVPVGKWETVRE